MGVFSDPQQKTSDTFFSDDIVLLCFILALKGLLCGAHCKKSSSRDDSSCVLAVATDE